MDSQHLQRIADHVGDLLLQQNYEDVDEIYSYFDDIDDITDIEAGAQQHDPGLQKILDENVREHNAFMQRRKAIRQRAIKEVKEIFGVRNVNSLQFQVNQRIERYTEAEASDQMHREMIRRHKERLIEYRRTHDRINQFQQKRGGRY